MAEIPGKKRDSSSSSESSAISFTDNDPTEKEIEGDALVGHVGEEDEVGKKLTLAKMNMAVANACRRYTVHDVIKQNHFYLSSGPVSKQYAKECVAYINDFRSKLAHRDALYDGNSHKGQRSGRAIILMRHGETLNRAFPEWHEMMKDEHAYKPYDLNQPPRLGNRELAEYALDSPITEIGSLSAQLMGRGISRCHLSIRSIVTSPALMCIETANTVLRQMESFKNKIIVEPGLFHWAGWYEDQLPKWINIKAANRDDNFWLDTDYKPIISEKDMQNRIEETINEYNVRLCHVMSQLMQKFLPPVKGILLVVGHSSTMDLCGRWLLGKQTFINNAAQLSTIGISYPFMSTIFLEELIGENDKRFWTLLGKRILPPLTIAGFSNNFEELHLKRRSEPGKSSLPNNSSLSCKSAGCKMN